MTVTKGASQRGVVWVIDDSEVEARVICQSLPGYTTQVFRDGSSFLEAVVSSARLPDAIVLDWQMPGVSGIEVCRFLRGRPDTLLLPILMLTGNQTTEDVVEGLEAGANDYVKKPFSSAELTARVEALVRTRALQERAERAESELRNLLAELPDALLVLDGNGTIEFANAMAEQMLTRAGAPLRGTRVETLLPGLLLDANAKAPADVRVHDRVYAPALRRMRYDAGEPRIVVTLRDVTEKRHLEERRLDFYSIIAHDLRAPLSSMHLRTSMMLEGARGELTAPIAGELGKLNGKVREMVELINDFLELARLEDPNIRIEKVPVDLVALAQKAIDDMHGAAAARHITVELASDAPKAVVSGDSRRLGQVLQNLLSNALKFAPLRGLVRIATVSNEHDVHVSVADNGPGIDAALATKIFDRYVRGSAPPGGPTGTGLGLMIVKEIVAAHGGSVGVETALGKGSTFWFRIPLGKFHS